MKKLSWKTLAWIAIVVAAVAVLANFSPSYTYVSITRPDGQTIQVEKSGFGPQRIRVVTPEGYVEGESR